MTSPLDLAALRAMAERTRDGAWTAKVCVIEEAEEYVGYAADLRTHEHNGDYDAEETARDDAEADATFVRACSPSVVLALIERLERLQRVEDAAYTVLNRRVGYPSGRGIYESMEMRALEAALSSTEGGE